VSIEEPYPVETLGEPVNQEDLAYTLLTFGYAIPHGLSTWGCRLSARDNEAFLHAWRVVAHLMGVSDELVPTSWSDARELFGIIQGRQKATSIMGQKLTGALTGFLGDYLPARLRPTLPAMLIRSQLGKADAQLILPSGLPAPGLPLRAIFAISLQLMKAYFAISHRLIQWLPALGTALGGIFRQAGDALVDSWRDDYQRLPFYIPSRADQDWVRQAGVDPALLQRWREKLFYTVVVGIVCLVAATVLGAGYAVLVPLRASGWLPALDRLAWSHLLLIGAGIAALYLAGLIVLQRLVSQLVTTRPGPPPPTPSASVTRVAVRRQHMRR
jgi:hypothetical protein